MKRTCQKCGRSLKIKEAMVGSKLCSDCGVRNTLTKNCSIPLTGSARRRYINTNFDALLATELKRL